MAIRPNTLSEEEKKARKNAAQKRYMERKRAAELEIPVHHTPAPQGEEVISRASFENLQQSYNEKCKQLEELSGAYRKLLMKSITDGEAAKHFVKTAMLGLELLFPNQNQGGQR